MAPVPSYAALTSTSLVAAPPSERFSVPGSDQKMTLTVNGKEFGSKLSLKNYAEAQEGDFAKGWTTSFAWPSLTKGTNTLTLSCETGDNCNVLLDQLWVKQGQVKK